MAAAPKAPLQIPDDQQFVHLHLHTEYSLLDGGNRVDKLVSRVAELGMQAVGMTDHGNIFGAVAFYQTCKEKGVKPILGVEAYVTPPDKPRTDRTYSGGGEGGYHLVLLAQNLTGWRNLLVLCSEAYLTGFYYKPRIDRELLEKHSEGLIAINGHLGSEIGEHLLAFATSGQQGHWEKAVESARWHARVFAQGASPVPRFYVELQHHVREQNQINPFLVKLARELELPLVCDNDAHFLRQEDHDAHDTLICISTAKNKDDPQRMKYSPELYVKGPREMRSLADAEGEEIRAAWKEASDNTLQIAGSCSLELPIGESHTPMVRVEIPAQKDLPKVSAYGGDLTKWYNDYCAKFVVLPLKLEGATEDERKAAFVQAKAECDKALGLLAHAGYVWRYGTDEESGAAKERRARLERELKILADKNISAYFLIVWDFVSWGRQRGIPSLARGSGVGTMVGYVLGLSTACPVEFGLLFERFTDPDRSEYPDIDIDLCQDGRADVLDYVRRKYGHVAQIITFGTLKARAAVRDVGRVLGMTIPEVDAIAKMIPEELGITLDRALEQEPALKEVYERDERVRRLIDNARALEGQARHASVHAAGVIVATRPLHEVVPLYKPSGEDQTEIVTQWDGPTCEKMGLLKMDFLGLRTLSVIERCKKIIGETLPPEAIWKAVGREEDFAAKRGAHPLDLDRLSYSDQKVFELFRRGETTGVFQFESGGMRRLLVEMKPDRLEDLIAANALFRPGPMDLIPDYNRRKHGQASVPKVHEIVDRHTAQTYGVMVYQEQVMQIVHELGGIPLRTAYSLIKAISKKKEKEINKQRGVFIEGAQKKGLTAAKAEELFEMILKFAGYGFNKSHSTGYAIVAYQTAYLKTFFPAQYMAAFLTYESAAAKVAHWLPYLEDCRRTRAIDPKTGRVLRAGIEVRPPDINRSLADFTVVLEESEEKAAASGHIRFGLSALKGASTKAITAIIAERAARGAYRSLSDFCERLPCGSVITKPTLEALVTCGAFDSMHGVERRAALLASLEGAIAASQRLARDRAIGQGDLFGGGGAETKAPAATDGLAGLEQIKPWTQSEMLAREKKALGLYVSSHPLEAWRGWTGVFATSEINQLGSRPPESREVLAALVQGVRGLTVKNGRSAGQRMAVLTLEDTGGTVQAVLFADAFARYGHLAQEDAALFVLGRVDRSRGEVQLLVDRLAPIDGVPLSPGRLQVRVDPAQIGGDAGTAMERAAQTIAAAAADRAQEGERFPVQIAVISAGRATTLITPHKVALTAELVRELARILGEGAVRLIGGVDVQREGRDQRGGAGRWSRSAPALA